MIPTRIGITSRRKEKEMKKVYQALVVASALLSTVLALGAGIKWH